MRIAETIDDNALECFRTDRYERECQCVVSSAAGIAAESIRERRERGSAALSWPATIAGESMRRIEKQLYAGRCSEGTGSV